MIPVVDQSVTAVIPNGWWFLFSNHRDSGQDPTVTPVEPTIAFYQRYLKNHNN